MMVWLLPEIELLMLVIYQAKSGLHKVLDRCEVFHMLGFPPTLCTAYNCRTSVPFLMHTS